MKTRVQPKIKMRNLQMKKMTKKIPIKRSVRKTTMKMKNKTIYHGAIAPW